MEARQGRNPVGGSMRYAHDSAPGHIAGAGDAMKHGWQSGAMPIKDHRTTRYAIKGDAKSDMPSVGSRSSPRGTPPPGIGITFVLSSDEHAL